jgi:hypothetical protein
MNIVLMKQTEFSRFYKLLSLMKGVGEREEAKNRLVEQFTDGRTTHLREMTRIEYAAMCGHLQDFVRAERLTDGATEAAKEDIRRARSKALHQMQLYGVDTADWTRVDGFCLHPRISGKRFAKLDMDELETLAVKVRLMRRKRGDEV